MEVTLHYAVIVSVLGEMTENGRNMSALPYSRDEMITWLRERERTEEAEILERRSDFLVHGTQEPGAVRVTPTIRMNLR